MNGPCFFVIGVQKGGTTTIHNMLRQHPSICLPEIKETHFFSDGHDEYDKGYEYYLSKYFSYCKEGKLSGEVDPEYLYFPETRDRLFDYNPDARLIVVIRNPIDRAYSHYWMTFRRGRENLTFDEAIKREEGEITRNRKLMSEFSYVDRGFYFKQLSFYLEKFSISNIKIIFFDDLIDSPGQALKSMHKFLGVEEMNLPELTGHSKNKGAMPMSMGLQKYLNKSSVSKSIFKSILSERSRQKIRLFIDKYNRNSKKIPPMSAEAEAYLSNIYRDDVLNLSKLLSKDLSFWLDAPSHD